MDGSLASLNHGSRSARSPSIAAVSLDRQLLLATLIGGLLLLWPLLVYGRPGDFQDSAAYYKGGRAAVNFVLDKLYVDDSAPVAPAAAPVSDNAKTAAGVPAAQDPQQIRGARSIAYSVAAYVLGSPRPQMWLLAAAQAFATAFVSAVALLLVGGNFRTVTAKLAVLAIATPVAFVACVIVPDIFAGIVILVIALLATAYRSLSPGVRAISIPIGMAGIAFHASHLPVALGVTLFAVALLLYSMRQQKGVPAGQWACVLAPFVLGAALTVALNSVAFGGASLTGKRFPLTLARSIAEGPARWYLDRNCGHLKYAICEVYPHGVPTSVDTFLWGKNGVKERATPEQLDRIRGEESEVVLASSRAYPFQEIGRLAFQFGRQLILFRPGVGLDARIVRGPDENPVSVPASYDKRWVSAVSLLSILGVVASFVLLLWRSRKAPQVRSMIGLIMLGIVLNAAICVYFSGVADRYQARVIWLIPLLALMALGKGGRRDAAAQAESRG